MNKGNIKGVFHLTNDNAEIFYNQTNEAICKLQDDGQKVEVQYQTNVLLDGKIAYSVLIIGRV